MAATTSTAPTIREQTIDGLRVLYLGPTALVASEKSAGHWYTVDPQSGCTCPDHTYRHHTCKHMRAAQVAAELDRNNSTPVEAVARVRTPEPPIITPEFRRLAGAYLSDR